MRTLFAVLFAAVAVAVLGGCSSSPHDLAARGDVEGLRIMLERNPRLAGSLTKDLRKTPLHYATTHRKPEAMELLIEFGASVEASDRTNMRPLHCAATRNAVAEAEILLKHGASLTAEDKFGDTPLHSAAIWGNVPIMELFIQWGADPNLKNYAGLTALDLARQQRKPEAAAFLEPLTGDDSETQ